MKHVRYWRLTTLSTMLLVAFLVALLTPLDVAAQSNGKGGKKPPPQPELSVGYVMTFLGTLDGRALEVNDLGVVVGWVDELNGERNAFRVVPDVDLDGNLIYDPDGMEDLNPGNWVDEAGDPIEEDWTAMKALGINRDGKIVGTAINTNGDSRVFQFDPLTELMTLLPMVGLGDHTGSAINDHGDIVGYRVVGDTTSAIFYGWDSVVESYSGLDLEKPVNSSINFRSTHLNNRIDDELQIVTAAGFRLTLSPTSTIVEDVGSNFSIRKINDSGAFTGTRHGGGRGKNKVNDAAFRWTGYPNGEPLAINEGPLSFGADINSDGDVCVAVNLYTNELGLLDLRDLVVNVDVGLMTPYGMNERDSTDFPQICGRAGDHRPNTRVGPFVLTPFNLTP